MHLHTAFAQKGNIPYRAFTKTPIFTTEDHGASKGSYEILSRTCCKSTVEELANEPRPHPLQVRGLQIGIINRTFIRLGIEEGGGLTLKGQHPGFALRHMGIRRHRLQNRLMSAMNTIKGSHRQSRFWR